MQDIQSLMSDLTRNDQEKRIDEYDRYKKDKELDPFKDDNNSFDPWVDHSINDLDSDNDEDKKMDIVSSKRNMREYDDDDDGNEYDLLPLKKKKNEDDILAKYDGNNIGMKYAQRGFVINDIKTLNRKEGDYLPREDGRIWTEEDKKRKNLPFSTAYNEDMELRKEIVERDDNVKFLTILAGKLNFNTLQDMYEEEPDSQAIRREITIRKSQSNTVDLYNIKLNDLKLELKNLKEKKVTSSFRVDNTKKLISNTQNILQKYKDALLDYDFNYKTYQQVLDRRTVLKMMQLYDRNIEIASSQLVGISGCIWRLAESFIENFESVNGDKSTYYNSLKRNLDIVKDSMIDGIFDTDEKRKSILYLFRLVKSEIEKDPSITLLNIADELGDYEDKKKNSYEELMITFIKLMKFLFEKGVIVANINDFYSDGISNENAEIPLDIGKKLPILYHETNPKDIPFSRAYQLYLKYGNGNKLPVKIMHENNNDIDRVFIQNEIRDRFTNEFSLERDKYFESQVKRIEKTSESNILGFKSDDYLDTITTYFNILKEYYEKWLHKNEDLKKRFKIVEERIKSIQKGEIQIEDPNVPYTQSNRWLNRPEISGNFKVIPVVTAAISTSFITLQSIFPQWSDVDIEFFQKDEVMMVLFSDLCAYQIAKSANKFPKRYMQLKHVALNKVDFQDTIEKFKKYMIIKEGNTWKTILINRYNNNSYNNMNNPFSFL